jgi:hypothetical protein
MKGEGMQRLSLILIVLGLLGFGGGIGLLVAPMKYQIEAEGYEGTRNTFLIGGAAVLLIGLVIRHFYPH